MFGEGWIEPERALERQRDREHRTPGALHTAVRGPNDNVLLLLFDGHCLRPKDDAPREPRVQPNGQFGWAAVQPDAEPLLRGPRGHFRGHGQQGHLIDRHARGCDGVPVFGFGQHSWACSVCDEPVFETLRVEPGRTVEILGMQRIDGAGDLADPLVEGAERRGQSITFPGPGEAGPHAQLGREPEQRRVCLVDGLGPEVEREVVPDRSPPGAAADAVTSLQDEDVEAVLEEAVRAGETRETRADHDHALHRGRIVPRRMRREPPWST